jgi:D-glycero-alpha-D-manno-heptose 1-phosphate guanylyltransferase
MQAIILAGGFGTRLQSVVKNVPKPMASIHGKPFLAYLIEYLKSQGITQVILSVHYRRKQIQAFFKSSYQDIDIQYAVEEQPLGTGGAIVNALQLMASTQPVFILNGDTFLKLNYQDMFAEHQKNASNLTIALRKIADCSRYGVVVTAGDEVTAFNEQGGAYPGLINAGVYLVAPGFFEKFPVVESVFSFEKDFLFNNIHQLKAKAFIVNEYFIDIGIPEDYARAIKDFS